MKFFASFLFSAVLLLLVSCDTSDDGGVVDNGYAYFPLTLGFYQVYDVTEITYTLRDPDTARYELRFVVDDAFLNSGGDSTFVLYRSRRFAGETAWTYLDTWSVRRNSPEVIVQEENTPYVKLRIPIRAGQTWNGNVYNTLDLELYRLDSVGVSRTLGGRVYDDCVTVVQSDNEDFIVYLDQRKEVYAPQAGLVYKETTQLHYCTDPDCLAQQLVERGVIYKQSLREYGREE